MKFLTTIILCIVISSVSSVLFDHEVEKILTVGAAASLKEVMEELNDDFQLKHPDMKVRLTCGATGIIRNQIAMNAPVDVFVSANETFGGSIDGLEKIIDKDSIRVMCFNSLVLIKSKASQGDISDIVKLMKDSDAKIAIGNPDYVPAGKYTRDLLEKLSLWKRSKSRFIYANNVRQVLAWVEQGIVDFGFVYKTDVLKGIRVEKIEEFKIINSSRITYPIALTNHKKNRKEAELFLEYINSSDASVILRKHGFVKEIN